MMGSEVISLAGLANFFKDDTNCISKGENKYKNDFVLKVQMESMSIESVVRASMNDRSYKVCLTVDGTGNFKVGSCDCVRGQWICSHMAATAIYINKTGVSKTDLPNSWIARPKKAARLNASIRIADHFPPKSTKQSSYGASCRPVMSEDLTFLENNLKDCSLKWILSPEPEPAIKNVLEPASIEDNLSLFMNDKSQFLKLLKVTPEQISWVASNTKSQRNSLLWGRLRRLRLTGSNFGKVLDCYNRNVLNGTPYPVSLFKSLRGEYSLDGKESVMWGQMHEEIAIKEYSTKMNVVVNDIGLCLFECGYLGASPDGIIYSPDGNNRVLEVKCPYRHRELNISDMIKAELKGKNERKDFFLKMDWSLNEKHSYWHQVQGEMYATKTEWADFVIWTKMELKILRIKKDITWGSNIEKLSDFYLNVLLPECYTTA